MPIPTARIRAALAAPDSFATTLLAAALAEFSAACLEWDPATVRDAASVVVGGPLPPGQFDRLMAAIAALRTDRFRRSPEAFVALASALNGNGAGPGHFDPPSAEDCGWALIEEALVRQLFLGDAGLAGEPYSPAVRRLLAETCRHEGIADPPDVLKLAESPAADADRRSLLSYSADPAAFAAIRAAQASKSAAIEAELRARLAVLVRQLGDLLGTSRAGVLGLIATAGEGPADRHHHGDTP